MAPSVINVSGNLGLLPLRLAAAAAAHADSAAHRNALAHAVQRGEPGGGHRGL